MENNYEDFRDLLIVNAGGELYVVDAPSHETNVSDLVAFDVDTHQEKIGLVIDKMWCHRKEAQYRCMARMNRIYPAKVIYRGRWAAPVKEA